MMATAIKPAYVGMIENHLVGKVTVSVNDEMFDFHMDMPPGATVPDWKAGCQKARDLGLMVMDDCEPDLLADGTYRFWLTPTEIDER